MKAIQMPTKYDGYASINKLEESKSEIKAIATTVVESTSKVGLENFINIEDQLDHTASTSEKFHISISKNLLSSRKS